MFNFAYDKQMTKNIFADHTMMIFYNRYLVPSLTKKIGGLVRSGLQPALVGVMLDICRQREIKKVFCQVILTRSPSDS